MSSLQPTNATMWQGLFKHHAKTNNPIEKLDNYHTFISHDKTPAESAAEIVSLKVPISVLIVDSARAIHALHHLTLIPAQADDEDSTEHFYALKGKGVYTTVIELPLPQGQSK